MCGRGRTVQRCNVFVSRARLPTHMSLCRRMLGIVGDASEEATPASGHARAVLKVATDLSDLVNYCEAVHFTSWDHSKAVYVPMSFLSVRD